MVTSPTPVQGEVDTAHQHADSQKCPHCLMDTTAPPKGVDVLYSWSISARKVVISAVLSNLTDGSTAWSVLQNEAHVVWAMESIGSTFALPVDEDLMFNAASVYRGWLMGGDQRPKPIAANPQPFFQMMLAHLMQIFQSRFLAGQALEKHVAVTSHILDLFLNLGRKRKAELSGETWIVFLKLLLKEADRLLRMKIGSEKETFANMLEDQLLRVTFELFLLSDSRDIGLWDYFQEVARRWTHRAATVTQWNATTKALALRMVQILYGKLDYTTDEVQVAIGGTTTAVEMSDDFVCYTWHRMFHVITNPNAITDSSNYLSAMEGIYSVVKAFLNVGAPTALKRAHPSISHAPNQVALLKLFGPWLLEAANSVRFGFEQGRAAAFASLCRIMVLRGGPRTDAKTLAQFYRSIYQALQSSDGLSIRSVIIHSAGIFSSDALTGVTSLVPCYVDQIHRILVTDAHLGQDVLLRRACISHLAALICLPNHLGHVPHEKLTRSRGDTREAVAASMPTKQRSRSSMLRASLEFVGQAKLKPIAASPEDGGDSGQSSAASGKSGKDKGGKKGFFTPAAGTSQETTPVSRDRAHSNPNQEGAHVTAVVTPISTTVDLTPAGLAKIKVNLWEAALHAIRTEKDKVNAQNMLMAVVLFVNEDPIGSVSFLGRALKSMLQLLDYQKGALSLTVLDALQSLSSVQCRLPRETFGLFTSAISAICNFVGHGLNKFKSGRGNSDADKLISAGLMTLLEWCVRVPDLTQDRTSLRSVIDVTCAALNLSPEFNFKLPVDSTTPSTADASPPPGSGKAKKKDGAGKDDDKEVGSGGAGAKTDATLQDSSVPSRGVDAALALLQHLVNYPSSFPQVPGGVRVSSRGGEEDLLADVLAAIEENKGSDGASTLGKPMNMQEKVAPYVRNFMYGALTILTVVEVPRPGESPFTAIIVRDETGKHIWRGMPLRSAVDILSALENAPGGDGGKEDEEGGEGDATEGGAGKMPRFSVAPGDAGRDRLQIDHQLSDALALRDLFLQSDSANSGVEFGGDVYHELLRLHAERERKACQAAASRSDTKHVVAQPPEVTFSYQDRLRAKFQLSRLFLTHIGLIVPTPTKGLPVLTQLVPGSKLDRSLKMLDKSFERDCHKIGVLYVGPGQQEQTAILRNLEGSDAFQDFVQSLGWKVDVTMHEGYLGGLDRRCSAGKYSQYFSDFKVEVMFHVPPMMPNNPREEQQIHKKKHTGNDIVNIVWSEHSRDFQPNTITSQFNHVTIVIYPLDNQLFRVSIHVKENEKTPVPVFGPLLDGMMVPRHILGPLVRMTAINANRVIKETQMGYRNPFSARAKLIREIATRYTAKLTTAEYYKGVLSVTT